jgi:hypothetical protein
MKISGYVNRAINELQEYQHNLTGYLHKFIMKTFHCHYRAMVARLLHCQFEYSPDAESCSNELGPQVIFGDKE